MSGEGAIPEQELEFEYSGEDARVLRRLSLSDSTTETFYMGGVYEEEVTTAASGERTYTYRYAVTNGGRAVAVVEREYDEFEDESWSRKYLTSELLGSTDIVTDESGAVVERHSYSAWGSRRSADAWWTQPSSTESPLVRVGYTGHQGQLDAGFVDMKGRLYDPAVGRMLQADPIVSAPTLAQAWNRYAYVGNNPLGYTDPTGYARCYAGDCPEAKGEVRYVLIDTSWFPALPAGVPWEQVDPSDPLWDRVSKWMEYSTQQNAMFSVDAGANPSPGAGDHRDEGFLAGIRAGAFRVAMDITTFIDQAGVDDFAAGYGDSASFGVTNLVREWQGTNDTVDKDSGAYAAGEKTEMVLGIVSGVATMKVAGKQVAKEVGEEVGGTIATRGKSGLNKLRPNADAAGPHTSVKRGPDGKVSGYETYRPSDPRNPNPWTSEKRVDVTGKPHYNKVTGQDVPTPHVQGRDIPGGVRPAEPWEIPIQ